MLKRACIENGFPFYEIDVIARSSRLPAMPKVDGPFVLHGRATLMLLAAADPFWSKGMFFDKSNFCHSAYCTHYQQRMLNAEARVMTWDEFLVHQVVFNGPLFIKPNDDLKYFTGDVQPSDAWCQKFAEWVKSGSPIRGSSEIIVSHPKEVDAEWRLFFINGRVVTGSMYRPSSDAYLPPDAVAFAEATAKIWEPAPVFVMDVARSDGSWLVVECNCFNGSRFYSSNVEAIVQAVSEFQETQYHHGSGFP